MKQLEYILEWGGTKRDIVCLLISAAALALSFLFPSTDW
jgi:hypothetical protein